MTDGDKPGGSKPTGVKSTGKRPHYIKPPAHLSRNTPVPEPDPLDKAEDTQNSDDPTRYGDWVHRGIAVDF